MSARRQVAMTKEVFILSNERNCYNRRGQAYIGKLKYAVSACMRSNSNLI